MPWFDQSAISGIGVEHATLLGAEILAKKDDINVLGSSLADHVLGGSDVVVGQAVHQVAGGLRIPI